MLWIEVASSCRGPRTPALEVGLPVPAAPDGPGMAIEGGKPEGGC
jgi:hypothetical protein